MPTKTAAPRCYCHSCSRSATRVYRLKTPSVGFPIEKDATQVVLFLTFFICDEHTDALTVAEVLTAGGAAEIIAKAFRIARHRRPPDFTRASLDTVPLGDPEFVAFQAGRAA